MSCNANCNQGRACDCCPNVDEPPEVRPGDWTDGERVAVVLVWLAAAVVVVMALGYGYEVVAQLINKGTQ